jgi:hypothetical protein
LAKAHKYHVDKDRCAALIIICVTTKVAPKTGKSYARFFMLLTNTPETSIVDIGEGRVFVQA